MLRICKPSVAPRDAWERHILDCLYYDEEEGDWFICAPEYPNLDFDYLNIGEVSEAEAFERAKEWFK